MDRPLESASLTRPLDRLTYLGACPILPCLIQVVSNRPFEILRPSPDSAIDSIGSSRVVALNTLSAVMLNAANRFAPLRMPRNV